MRETGYSFCFFHCICFASLLRNKKGIYNSMVLHNSEKSKRENGNILKRLKKQSRTHFRPALSKILHYYSFKKRFVFCCSVCAN
jgi:hypothetical protein